MSLMVEVLALLDETLSLSGRSLSFGPQTHLRGALPEFDSMAVVAVLAALEDRFGIEVHDDEINGDTFATVDTLVRFVASKLDA